jgi:hypothetical protein
MEFSAAHSRFPPRIRVFHSALRFRAAHFDFVPRSHRFAPRIRVFRDAFAFGGAKSKFSEKKIDFAPRIRVSRRAFVFGTAHFKFCVTHSRLASRIRVWRRAFRFDPKKWILKFGVPPSGGKPPAKRGDKAASRRNSERFTNIKKFIKQSIFLQNSPNPSVIFAGFSQIIGK